jgi:hypothetical protein
MKKKTKFKESVDEVVPSKNLVELTVPRPDMSKALAAESLLDAAKKIKIVDQRGYEDAAATLIKLSSKETEIDDQRTALKKPINQAAATVQALFKPALTFLEEAKAIIKKEMGAYYEREEAKRLATEQKAEDDAAAERQRLLEAAAKSRNKSVRTDLEAAAQNVTCFEVHIPPPVASGISMRENWEWEVEDESLIPREYLVVDEVAINALVRAKKDKTRIPGIKVKSSKKPAVGGR